MSYFRYNPIQLRRALGYRLPALVAIHMGAPKQGIQNVNRLT